VTISFSRRALPHGACVYERYNINKGTRDLYRCTNECKKGYNPRINEEIGKY
jgi:hypothetical protein